MSCPSGDTLVGFIEGELPLNQHHTLELHARECASCRAQLAELRRIIARIALTEGEWDGVDLLDPVATEIDGAREIGVAREIDMAREIDAAREVVNAGDSAANASVARDAAAHDLAKNTTRGGRRGWPRRRLARWALVAAPTIAAAAVALVVVLAPPPSRRGGTDTPGSTSPGRGFQSRGATSRDGGAEKWVRLWVYRRTASGYVAVTGSVRQNARLVFGYRNSSAMLRYVMIFGVDGDGRVYWYYPAHEARGKSQRADQRGANTSISIKRGKHELPDEVFHRLKAGPMTIHAIFSTHPLRVDVIARDIARRGPAGRAARLVRPSAHVAELIQKLEVVASP